MFTKYPIQDRVLPIVWDLLIVNGFGSIVETDGPAFPEIHLRDELLQNTYWVVYVKNGVIGVESTDVVQHDPITFFEPSTGYKYAFGIRGGAIKSRIIHERTNILNYYLQDRTLPIVWNMFISNGFLKIEASLEDDQGEINVLDEYLPNTYWTIFIRNGILGIESSALQFDTLTLFREEATTKLYRLGVKNAVLRCPQIVILSTDEFNVTLILKNIRTDLRASRIPVYLEKPNDCISSDRRLLRIDLKNSELPVSYERKEYER